MMTRTRAELALAGMAMIWGVSFVVMKQALEQATPVVLLAVRFSLAAVLLSAGARWLGIRWNAAGLRWILLAGVFLAAGYVLQTTGLRYTTAGKSGFLTGLYIVLLPLLGWFVYGSAPQFREWTGVWMSACGMAVMNWDASGGGMAWGWGESLTVMCAFLFAAHLMTLDRAAREMDARLAGLLQIALAAVIFWLTLPVVETPRIDWSPGLGMAIAATAVFSTALPLTLMAWAQQHTTPLRTALLLSLEMPFAALAGWWWLGERLTGVVLAGAGMILAGVMLVELKPEGVPVHLGDVEAP
jgi:drug/metabolite transporter (DMT)-like permease